MHIITNNIINVIKQKYVILANFKIYLGRIRGLIPTLTLIYFSWSTEAWDNIFCNLSKVSVSGTNLFECYWLPAFIASKYLVICIKCNLFISINYKYSTINIFKYVISIITFFISYERWHDFYCKTQKTKIVVTF